MTPNQNQNTATPAMRTPTLTAEQALPLAQLSVEQMVRLSATDLYEAHVNLLTLQSMVKRMLERFHAALEQRYAERAAASRLAEGRDFGVCHLTDGPLHIAAELPKRVDWDQEALAEIAQRIRACGENMEEYVDIDYAIPESRFAAWPSTLKDSFAKARTVKPGKASYRLSMAKHPAQGASR